MRTRRRRIRSRAYAAAVLAAMVAAIAGPTAALAGPADVQYPRPVPQTNGVTPSDFVKPAADRGHPGRVRAAGRSRRQGRRHTGRLPRRQPSADHAAHGDHRRPAGAHHRARRRLLLPLILASLALLVALGIAGTALVHQRSVRPGRAA